MSADLEIRRATVGDATSIAQVHVAAWQAAYAGLLPAAFLSGLRAEHRRDGWARTLTADVGGRAATFLAVRNGGEVVGFVDVRPSRDDDADSRTTGEVTSLYVAPEHWANGVGRALMGRALAWLHETGRSDAMLWVLRENARARLFYERTGWRLDGNEKVAVVAGAPVTEVRYRRTVQPGSGGADQFRDDLR